MGVSQPEVDFSLPVTPLQSKLDSIWDDSSHPLLDLLHDRQINRGIGRMRLPCLKTKEAPRLFTPPRCKWSFFLWQTSPLTVLYAHIFLFLYLVIWYSTAVRASTLNFPFGWKILLITYLLYIVGLFIYFVYGLPEKLLTPPPFPPQCMCSFTYQYHRSHEPVYLHVQLNTYTAVKETPTFIFHRYWQW